MVRELCFNYTADNGTCYDCVSCPDLSCVSNDTLHGYSCIEFLTDAYESCFIPVESEIAGERDLRTCGERHSFEEGWWECGNWFVAFMCGYPIVVMCYLLRSPIIQAAGDVGNRLRSAINCCCWEKNVSVPSGETE